jgi:hypothetical protein
VVTQDAEQTAAIEAARKKREEERLRQAELEKQRRPPESRSRA